MKKGDTLQKKKLEELFKKRLKMASTFKSLCLEFDHIVEKEFGMTHNDTDDDQMIDSLDYGATTITFEEFVDMMNYYKSGTKIPYSYAKNKINNL